MNVIVQMIAYRSGGYLVGPIHANAAQRLGIDQQKTHQPPEAAELVFASEGKVRFGY